MSRERASTMQSSGGATNCRLMAPAVRRRLAGHGLVRRRGLTCRQDARGQDAPRQHASGRRVQPATQRGEPLPAHLGPGRWVAESLAAHEAMDLDTRRTNRSLARTPSVSRHRAIHSPKRWSSSRCDRHIASSRSPATKATRADPRVSERTVPEPSTRHTIAGNLSTH